MIWRHKWDPVMISIIISHLEAAVGVRSGVVATTKVGGGILEGLRHLGVTMRRAVGVKEVTMVVGREEKEIRDLSGRGYSLSKVTCSYHRLVAGR